MNKSLRTALQLCLLIVPLAQAATPPATPVAEESLDEVTVNGTRLDEIFQEMVKVEDKFFDRYNELNTNDDFDTHCNMEAKAGTAIRRRFCRAVYAARALEVEGQEYFLALPSYSDPTPRPWAPPVAANNYIEARRKAYQQNIRDVVSRNPELVKLLRERYELGKRYEATRRKVFGLKTQAEKEDLPAGLIAH